MNDELNKEIILEHYSHPSNFEKVVDNSYKKITADNGSCIDKLNFYIKIENDTIKDIKYEGEACAISMASSSIASENLIGKTIDDAISYINDFDNMINQKPYNDKNLGEACAFCTIYKQNNRKNCAFLPYKGLKSYLESYKQENTDYNK